MKVLIYKQNCWLYEEVIGINRNVLKIIAALSMFVDHFGYEIFPEEQLFRIIGRIAFPLFAYFIFEGCKYTRNRLRYFGQIFILGIVCMAVYYWYSGDIYGNILITFSLSILNISFVYWVHQKFDKMQTLKNRLVFFLGTALIFLFTLFICEAIYIDYGFYGVMVPVIVAIFDLLSPKDKKLSSIIGLSIGLLLMSIEIGGIQYISLISVFLLLVYNRKRGKCQMKYFFYIFYPLRLLLIESISMMI